MEAAIKVCAPDKEVIQEVGSQVLAILNTTAGDAVKIAALQVVNTAGISCNSISNCQFEVKEG